MLSAKQTSAISKFGPSQTLDLSQYMYTDPAAQTVHSQKL